MDIKEKVRKVEKSKRKRKGLCIVCGDRVHSSEDHIQVSEGYCHTDCVFKGEGRQPAIA